MENKYYVYIFLDPRKPGKWEYNGITFDFQPFYVGKGQGRRMNSHFDKHHRKVKSIKNHVIQKIENLGLEVIRRKIFENLQDNESKNIEIDIIAKFGRRDLGTGFLTNQTFGGDGASGSISAKRKKVYQYSLGGEFIQSFESVTKAVEILKINIKVVRKNGEVQSGGFQWFYEDRGPTVPPVIARNQQKCIDQKSFKILSFDENWELIKEYFSTNEACRDLNTYGKAIVRAILTKSLYRGRYWAFEEGFDINSIGAFKQEEIHHYDRFGNFVKTYKSRGEAQIETGIHDIGKYLSGKLKFPMDFRFFKEYQGEKILPLESFVSGAKKVGLFHNYDDLEPHIIFESIKDAADFVESDFSLVTKKSRLGKACRYQKKDFGFYWKFLDPNLISEPAPPEPPPRVHRKVFQYDLSGNFIQEFETRVEAAKFLNAVSSTAIWLCCWGEGKTSLGYQWSFEKLDNIGPARPSNIIKKAVLCFDLNGKFVKEYPTLTSAAKAVNINNSGSIAKACGSPKRTCAGFRWKFKENGV